jgi:hypothetical protein
MALTELNRPSKDNFYRTLQNNASNVSRMEVELAQIVTWLADRDAADLTAIGVPTELHAGLGQLRGALTRIQAAIAAEEEVLRQYRIMDII